MTEVNGEKIETANQHANLPDGSGFRCESESAARRFREDGSREGANELPGTAAGAARNGNAEGGTKSALEGVTVETLDAQTAQEMKLPANTHGVVASDVAKDVARYSAGLRQGDVIQEVNRKAVTSVDQFNSAMHNASGGNVLLLVNRNGFTQYLAIQK